MQKNCMQIYKNCLLVASDVLPVVLVNICLENLQKSKRTSRSTHTAFKLLVLGLSLHGLRNFEAVVRSSLQHHLSSFHSLGVRVKGRHHCRFRVIFQPIRSLV